MNARDLKQFALLAELGEADREAVAELLEERTASQGVALFREGSEAEGLVLVTRGTARLESRRSTDQVDLRAGDSLGALSLVAVGSREATAIAETSVTYWLLPRTSFRRLAEDHPRSACRLAEAILVETAGSMRDALDLVQRGAGRS